MNNEFNELVSDFETKLQNLEGLAADAKLSFVTGIDIIAIMRDLLSIFKAMQ